MLPSTATSSGRPFFNQLYLYCSDVTSSFVTSRLELTVCNAQNIRRYYYSPFYVRISDRRRLLVVSRVTVSARHGCRAFSVAGPTLWNSLPDNLRDPTETRQLQISLENVFLLLFSRVINGIRRSTTTRSTNARFSYLLFFRKETITTDAINNKTAHQVYS